jgi:hypothetical protein
VSDYGEQKLLDLTNRLIAGTELGQVDWQTTDNETAFVCTLRAASVAITSVDDDGVSPFSLLILDQSGDVVDSLTTRVQRLPAQDSGQIRVAPWNEPLERLYEVARRNALNIDKIVDELLAELPNIDPPF